MHDLRSKIWFVINTFFTLMYLMWRLFFTIPFEYGMISILAGFFLFFVEALGMVEAFVHYANMYNIRPYKKPEDIRPEEYPDVDVFIATYSEEPALLYKTINGCKHLNYPDPSKVHIYVCDDNRRSEVRSLAESMGVNYLDRPDNKGAKAGNLNNALKHSSSPYILTLDADMIVQSCFLMETMPYIVDAERRNRGRKEKDKIKLGYIQTPQAFYNPDLFQYNLFSEGRIPNEQDYFYRDIQIARTRNNSVIYGGSNTIISREALEEIGGFYTGAITEDFATGILIQQAGYVTLGLGRPLASGLSPTDLPNLIQQRVRWARGVIATGRKMHIFRSRKMSFSQKMNYWASVYYWYAPVKRLIYILSPILYGTFNFMIFKCTLPEILIFWLPMYISSNISLSMLSEHVRNSKWTGIYETILFPYMLIPVLLESFGITLNKFKVTDKSDNSKGQVEFIYMLPFLTLIILSLIGVVRCILIMFQSNSFSPIVILFWLLNNLFLLVMSVFFTTGRAANRKFERFPIVTDCTVHDSDLTVQGKTMDLSEEGMAVILNKPYMLGDVVTVDVSNDMYSVSLRGEVVYVSEKKMGWGYSIKINDYMGYYDSYLELLYDRIPMLPSEIKADVGSFDDLLINTKKRVDIPFYQKRKFARIDIGLDSFSKGRKMHVLDFNYEFLSVVIPDPEKRIRLSIFEDLTLELLYEREIGKDHHLYRVLNIYDIVADRALYLRLMEWLVSVSKKAHEKREELEKQERMMQKMAAKNYFNEMDLV